MSLQMPVRNPTHYASFESHTRRSPRSTEAGTDMFVPIGTPVYAPGPGVIYGYGNTIAPMTGRWVGIDLDNGMRFRCMHHSRLVRTSGRVAAGDVIAYSGASGYGYEDWSRLSTMPGAHTHVTLWPTWASRYGYGPNGRPFSVDFMNYVGGTSGGGNSGEWDEMASEAQVKKAAADAVFEVLTGVGLGPGGRNVFDSLKFTADLAAAGVAENVWKYLLNAQDANGRILDVKFPASGFLASTNARVGVSADQVKTIADAVVKQIGAPSVSIDYAAIAKAVNDDASKRLSA